MSPNPMSLSILVPVYNEETTVVEALKDLLEAEIGTEREIIVVDDGSTDGTAAALAAESWPDEVTFISHDQNRGKGAAVHTGLAAATGTHTAIMDADLEYSPDDIGKLVAAASEGHEVVFGTRAFEAHTSYSFWYVMGNRFVTQAGNMLFNCWLSDMCCCHKLLPTELFRQLELSERGFAVDAEIAARLLRRDARIYEVPVSYQARSREEGKKLTMVDGFRVLRALVRCRVS
jgi:dolichol-phosphate hexosyltransferase